MKIKGPQIGQLENSKNLLQEIEYAMEENIDVKNKEFKEFVLEEKIVLEKV